jgi:large subunit ribosomal protein L24
MSGVMFMRNEWSRKWVGSSQPRKQRKYRANAPLHAKRKMAAANLSQELRERYGRRSMVPRKGDEVKVMRGDSRGKAGVVEKVDIVRGRVHIEGVKRKKVDGSEIPIPIVPSNLQITKLTLEDKMRQAVLERSGVPQEKKNAKKDKKEEKSGE